MTEPQAPTVIILAAGEGKRMKSAKPKVLHELCGRTMLGHVVAAAQELAPHRLAVVVGKGRELVAPHVERIAPEAAVVVQDPQNGTGQAARLALEALTDSGGEPAGTVLVLLGDGAMVTGDTLRRLIAEHEGAGNAVTDLTAVVPDPTGLGRVLREPDGTAHGRVIGIVEQKDCTPAQATIHEVNSGIFAFDPKVLRDALGRLTTDNAQGEELLTDVMAIAVGDGLPVGAVVAADHHEVLAANDRAQLADLRRLMNQRITRKWMVEGVTIIDPATTWIDVQATLEPDATLRPNTQLEGATHIASGADVGPNCTLKDTSVGADARVTNATTDGAEIGPEANVGPYTYLRPGTRLGRKSKAGGFVEMKKSTIGDGTKVPHLAYIGDATIGEGCNIGAGVITANYDGYDKFPTRIGDHAFVGTNSTLIAPAEIGDGAYVAAGSVLTLPVGPGELAVARGKQRNIAGYVARKRPGSKAAQAAARAVEAGAEDDRETNTTGGESGERGNAV
ncbi:MAG: bifunctional UDP-N-acetylglucosamine diphosphorylase/glucosamine-1-phosphate N-acetyltransferase GlmU [Catenulisporales bacterium]|jgi:bifunctional UDP-N-acetylglucosamine pyrophosphorylase / glucosamine-1-phosphate N-acetyltransferase|nr:bifunctional UDP-N-acetylglucosamine diphosphorylase/glucosamine-1-phosphate N-acetyltransferase GlmU [Catenulisporales bacterium]